MTPKEVALLNGVISAWHDPGSHPPYHLLMQNELRRSWRTLAQALDALPRAVVPEERAISPVTDEQVEIACASFYNDLDGRTQWRWDVLVLVNSSLAAQYRARMRVALETERKVR